MLLPRGFGNSRGAIAKTGWSGRIAKKWVRDYDERRRGLVGICPRGPAGVTLATIETPFPAT